MRPTTRRVLLVYGLSGLVSLGYQVAWFRILTDWFGSTNLTFALVVCSFIGGLGAGALLSRGICRGLGRRLGISDGLRLYGVIELWITATASLTVLAAWLPADLWGDFPYHLSDGIWVQDAGYRMAQLVIATSCVFLPCFLMGTTFPLICDLFVAEPHGDRLPAALYAFNTVGACAGVLICQFLLLPWLGHYVTYGLMLGINLLLGAYLFVVGGAPTRHEPTAAFARRPARAGHGLLLACATLSGLLAGALEGDMFKRISFSIGNFPGATLPFISFWAILGIFVASALVHRYPNLRLTQVKLAFIAATAYYFIAARLLYPAIQALDASSEDPSILPFAPVAMFPTSLLQFLGFIGAIVFVPYCLISLLLPWVCNHVQAERRHLGLAYGLNTIAFCVGLIGFTLVAPRVNIFYSLKLFGILMVCGVGLLLFLSERRKLEVWPSVLASAAFITGCLLVPSEFDASYLDPNSEAARAPVEALKSDGATTSFVAWSAGEAILYFGNTPMSGTNILAQSYMRLMAHFPLLVQDNPTKALLICFGVGNTASAIAMHDTIRQIDVVDLNYNVFTTASVLSATNFGVAADPRVRLIHDDGRSFLRLTTETYDLITSEPPPPMMAGVYRLYSSDYYDDVLAHLTPGGVMTQWLPSYQMPKDAVELAVATFVRAFPESMLIVGYGQELILVGSRQPIDLRRLHRRFFHSRRVLGDMKRIRVDEPRDLLVRIMSTGAALQRAYGAGSLIRDRHNQLDQLLLAPGEYALIEYAPQQVLDFVTRQLPESEPELRPVLTHLGRLRYRVHMFPFFQLACGPEIALCDADWTRITYLQRLGGLRQAEGDAAGALTLLNEALALAPEQPQLLLIGAEMLNAAARPAEAAEFLRGFHRLEPDEPLPEWLPGR